MNIEQPVFCDTCTKRVECWEKHKNLVEAEHPIETAAFIAAVDQAKASGDEQAGGHLAVRLMIEGKPDPWIRGMLDNFKLGASEKSLGLH